MWIEHTPQEKIPLGTQEGAAPGEGGSAGALASGYVAVFRRAHAQAVAAPGRRHGGLIFRVPAGGGRNRILCSLPGKRSFS